MSWELGFDEDDAFFQTSFEQPHLSDSNAPFFFQPDDAAAPQDPIPGVPSEPSRNLADENAELRQTASSLRERFAQITSVNANLKSQLEECRSRFRNAIFSGFATRK
jgi:hypothetical protein